MKRIFVGLSCIVFAVAMIAVAVETADNDPPADAYGYADTAQTDAGTVAGEASEAYDSTAGEPAADDTADTAAAPDSSEPQESTAPESAASEDAQPPEPSGTSAPEEAAETAPENGDTSAAQTRTHPVTGEIKKQD
ncbi:MAG: hypothetical protein LBQ15_03480 [Clostridium sp.]|jgi:hypothetical protein|nr:hypothetical protein [Clostridium sp.]